MRHSPLILIVEDSDDDFAATERAFAKANLRNLLRRCRNGDEALNYLFRSGAFADPKTSPRPGMILLDLNMPGTDGRGVLGAIKADASLRSIPVIVLTTSDADQDVAHCYAMGANSYVQKPVDMKSFITAIGRLKDFWLEIALLPKAPN